MYTLTIKLLSPTMLMSGQGDVNTDSTVVHDRYGIPFIPAKRVRGVLYESALEVAEMVELSELKTFTIQDVNCLFNHTTETSTVDTIVDCPRLSISNLMIPHYDKIAHDIEMLQNHHDFKSIFTKNRVLAEFTSIRYYTSVDSVKGTVIDGSLHNSRVINKGLTFSGTIGVRDMTETDQMILACAVNNLTGIGGKRNRGFGNIECSIDDEHFDVQALGGALWSK